MVSKVLADGGPTMKRFRAATMGRANHIKKRTSHIQIELDLAKKNLVVPAKASPKSAQKAESKSATKHGGITKTVTELT